MPDTSAAAALVAGQVGLAVLTPSPENELLYRPPTADPDLESLARDIAAHGIREPLVVTRDNYILSGHRRYAAARMAGLDVVPVRYADFARSDRTRDDYVKELAAHNQQRVKTLDEQLREKIVAVNPEQAHAALVQHRREQSKVAAVPMIIRGAKTRHGISAAKKPFLDSIMAVVEARREYWPLSVRQIHYALLNNPPMLHAKKSGRYSNTRASYQQLCELALRARLDGRIPWKAVSDETRPQSNWPTHHCASEYIAAQADRMFKTYWRDLMQSQTNHVEIVGEKNTVQSIVHRVAADYTVPYTIGRGYCSGVPRYEMAQRYRMSGKSRLVLVLLSDHDPDGEEISQSFVRSIRDDFGVQEIVAVRAAITPEQIEDYDLPPMMTAKKTSTNYAKFHAQHGDAVYELEALPPDALEQILRDTIGSVIDTEAFNYELEKEVKDAAFLDEQRQRVLLALRGDAR